MSELIGGCAFIYILFSCALFTGNLVIGFPVDYKNWTCTASKVTSTGLPKRETCTQWTTTESKDEASK